MTRVIVTAVIAPPPHLARNGVRQDRLTMTCELAQIDTWLGHYARVAERAGVFDAGGALTLLVQRAPAVSS